MDNQPLLAKKTEDETKLMLKYAKNNGKDLEGMEMAMAFAGHLTNKYTELRGSSSK